MVSQRPKGELQVTIGIIKGDADADGRPCPHPFASGIIRREASHAGPVVAPPSSDPTKSTGSLVV